MRSRCASDRAYDRRVNEPSSVTHDEQGPFPRERELVGELMDDPGLDEAEHRRALRGLERLNRLSAAHAPIVGALAARARAGPFVLLDVASGSGDVLVRAVRGLHPRGVDVRAHACDVSAVACTRIEQRFRGAGIPVRVEACDALAPGALGEGTYDGVMNALFLHHLTRDDAARLLGAMARALKPGGVMVVSDLVRTRACYAMAWLASRAVTRSRVVRVDALRSVRAAFSVEELPALAGEAGLDGATVTKVWPERAVLVWEKA